MTMIQNHNRQSRIDNCLICEEKLGNFILLNLESKDYYLYMCSHCNSETPYCFKCNRAIDILLNSNFFKCFHCTRLIKISSRETYYFSRNEDLFINMFQNHEEAKLISEPFGNNNRFEFKNKPGFFPNPNLNMQNNFFEKGFKFFNPCMNSNSFKFFNPSFINGLGFKNDTNNNFNFHQNKFTFPCNLNNNYNNFSNLAGNNHMSDRNSNETIMNPYVPNENKDRSEYCFSNKIYDLCMLNFNIAFKNYS